MTMQLPQCSRRLRPAETLNRPAAKIMNSPAKAMGRAASMLCGLALCALMALPVPCPAADVYTGAMPVAAGGIAPQERQPINVITDPQFAHTGPAVAPAPSADAIGYDGTAPMGSGQGVGQGLGAGGPVPTIWQPLVARLAAEGISGQDVDTMFAALGEVASQDPMGRKVRELYMKAFVYTPPDPNAPKKPRLRLYKGVVNTENAVRCRIFIQQHSAAFARAEQQFGVPPEIAAALLFVETRLGSYVGKERALYTLASMARSTEPDSISDWLPGLPGYEQHLDWMQELMPKRADWAYKELRALVVHVREHGLEPATVPGSIYGAVGLCQFMPSNLVTYGADGDDDGVIDLFTVPDAVASLSKYLSKHGWKKGISREKQHAVLKTYNRIDIYANTILALSDMVKVSDTPYHAKPGSKAKPGPKPEAPAASGGRGGKAVVGQ